MSSARDALLEQLAAAERHVAVLEAAHAGMLAASEASNADDEHDPEGATIAFERQQVVALLDAARRSRQDLRAALSRVADGTYGTCEYCGGDVGDERLQARPFARECIACAR